MTTSTTATMSPEKPPLPQSHLSTALMMTAMCGANFLTIYASGAVTIALPTIALEFNIEESQLQWVVSAYALTFAGFLLILGRLADIYGQKRMFMLGMLWFAVWSVVCGFMKNVVLLDIARAFQGMGAAGAGPSAAGMLGKYFHGRPHERNVAFSIFGATNPLGFVVGTFLGGVFTETIGWRWLFHICGIAAVLIVILAYYGVAADDVHPDIDRRVDSVGASLGTTGIILLTYAVSAGNTDGWSAPQISACFVLSVVLLAAFIKWEDRCPYPVLPLGLFKLHGFAAMVVVLFAIQWTFGGTYLFHLTLLFQNVYALSPLTTAVHLLPLTIAGAIAAIASAPLILHFPKPKIAISTCLALMTLALSLFAFTTQHTDSYWKIIFPSQLLVVVGYELVYNYCNILVQSSVGPHQQSLASGVFTTTTQIANGIGLAVETTISSSVNTHHAPTGGPPLLTGYRAAMLAAAGLQFLSLVFSLIFITRDMPEEASSDHSGGLTHATTPLAMEMPVKTGPPTPRHSQDTLQDKEAGEAVGEDTAASSR
ncbi:major facilitator superfamily domain-containing protein [Powellomyces hirtus]|nr:major facilitator superfamily domain-containing protein [Powellomyces hirtus]